MIIDGKAVAREIREEIREVVQSLTGRPPCLAVILVGEHPASKLYVGRKVKACQEVGFTSIKCILPEDITLEALVAEISEFNADPNVDGILVQLPLPEHIDSRAITEAIDPTKDVDGFHPLNVGKLLNGDPDCFFSCTPYGIKTLIEKMDIDIRKKHVVIVGRSNIVGKPMAAMLLQREWQFNATVTVVNRNTPNIKELCSQADILIVAIGVPRFITADMVKEGATVIDVGINSIDDPHHPGKKKIVGDVDFDEVKDKCAHITPVPGGVGPMTIAMLLQNTLKSYHRRFA